MIDLHTHSTASDGSCTPERLIEIALGAGLSALALTDHDTLDGLPRARARAKGTGLRFIPGVEIEIEIEKGEFHLLGIGLTGDIGPLAEALSRVQESRRGRNLRIVEKMQAGGIPITMEEVAEIAGGEIVSRAHFARVLVRKKIVGSIDAAFKRLIGKGMPYYEPRACLLLNEATSLIRRAGGIAVIAHPVSLGIHGPALRECVSASRDQGVGGIEAWHPNHSVKESRRLERLALSLGMSVTGGSDFHGEHIPSRRLGLSSGGREIPDRFLEAIPRAAAHADESAASSSLNPLEA
jgi:predicted metal-dependent phosphoesterase TrpH